MSADIAPAALGDVLCAVDTPACVVDLDAVEANIARAVALVEAASATVKIRPHFKAHKCVEIARLQCALSRGRTTGVCCQKVCEAEAAVAGGITDVLVTNEVVGASKIARLVRLLLAPGVTVGVLVDDSSNAVALSTAVTSLALPHGRALEVLVEVDVGQRRCGVPDAAAAVALGAVVHALPGLRLCGIQCYHGGLQHLRALEDRAAGAAAVAAKARDVAAAFAAAGLPCPVITGGGSGTFALDAAAGVLTEVQPGSYVLNDADYSRNRDAAGAEMWTAWTPSLFLLSTVMSRRAAAPAGGGGGWVVLDAGLKAQSVDSGLPVVVCAADEYRGLAPAALGAISSGGGGDSSGAFGGYSLSHLAVQGVSDEHATVAPAASGVSAAPSFLPAIGTKVLLMPGHCDPFVNHFDWAVAVRGGVVAGVWRIASRSPGV